VLFELDLDALLERPVPAFMPVSRQQPVQRDVALVVGESVSHDALVGTLRGADALIRSATLFDIYRPPAGAAGFAPGERSLAVRLELLDFDTTLTEERIQDALDAALARAREAHGARLRA
jgi:phenylalanyl-tRNA synthetase beta chain